MTVYFGYMISKYSFNYYDTILTISKNASKAFDKVYSDLKNNDEFLFLIDKDDKKATIEILEGMVGLCEIVKVSTNRAKKCINLLSNNPKSKSSSSYSDIENSAKFVLSNKYLSKKESIEVLEERVKYGDKRTIKDDVKKIKFMYESQRSKKIGFLQDVLNTVYYYESQKQSGTRLCSKEYNNKLSNVITGLVNSKGNVEYGRLVKEGLRFVATKVDNDLNKGCRANDFIKAENAEPMRKYTDDLEKCTEKSYSLGSKIDKLDWFVGGDENKIVQLQEKLNAEGVFYLLVDGVFGKLTEDAFIRYIDKLLKLSENGPIVVVDEDNKSWVIGLGAYQSGHIMAGGSLGKMVYWDDKGNIAIMNTYVANATTDVEYTGGRTFEMSTTAKNVNDMAGKSFVVGGGGDVWFGGISGTHATSLSDSSITTKSISAYTGLGGFLPFGGGAGISSNVPLLQFNPKEWLKNYLGIK